MGFFDDPKPRRWFDVGGKLRDVSVPQSDAAMGYTLADRPHITKTT